MLSILIVLLSFVAYFLINYCGSLVLELFLMSVFQDNENIVLFYQIGCRIITCFLAFPALLAINRVSVSKIKTLFHRNTNVKSPIILCIAVVLLSVAIIPMLVIRFFLPEMPITPPDIITGIWLVLISPIIEESIFRGVMIQRLKKYNIIFTVLLTSILFSVGHLNISNMLISFLPGVILAIVAVKTDSIFYTVPLHMLVNLCGSIILPFILSV